MSRFDEKNGIDDMKNVRGESTHNSSTYMEYNIGIYNFLFINFFLNSFLRLGISWPIPFWT